MALRPLAVTLVLSASAAAACADDAQETLGADTTAPLTTGDAASSTGAESTGPTSTGDDPSAGDSGLVPLPPLGHVPWTTEERILPSHPVADAPTLDPRDPALLEQLLADGYGAVHWVAGEPIVDRTLDGAPAPSLAPAPVLLGRFVHLADVQLADDESPTRVALLDNTESLTAAFRPQESYACRALDAAARTINAIHAEHPLDLVLLGGDNIDSAQRNELAWFQGILDGAPQIHCDSGIDDDPVPGPGNDPKDPFAPVGLDVPWRWVSGNHDVLVQGNFTRAAQQAAALGDQAPGGTRDWSRPGGPIVDGTVPPDPERALLSVADLLAHVSAAGDGHGIDAAVQARGRALYTFPLAGTPVVFLVIDTAAETGGAAGLLREADVDGFIRPALDAAEAAGERVIVASHHCSTSLGDGGGLGGTTQPDAVPTAEWQALLAEYPNLLMHLCAHSHTHRARVIQPAGGGAYWEVATASLADHPQQIRVLEIHDQGDGRLTITGIAVDYAVDDDPLAADGRARSVIDVTSAWRHSGEGGVEDRNVRLWVSPP